MDKPEPVCIMCSPKDRKLMPLEKQNKCPQCKSKHKRWLYVQGRKKRVKTPQKEKK